MIKPTQLSNNTESASNSTPTSQSTHSSPSTPASRSQNNAADTFDAASQTTSPLASSVSEIPLSELTSTLLSNLDSTSLIQSMVQSSDGLNSALAQALQAQGLSPSVVTALLAGHLDQISMLASQYGLSLQTDGLGALAQLNGQASTLLGNFSDAAIFWRTLSLTNPPLNIPMFIHTTTDIRLLGELLPDQSYRIRGTFLDAEGRQMVRLETQTGQGDAEEEGILSTGKSVASLTNMQRATLLALIANAHAELQDQSKIQGIDLPARAACCMFTHSLDGAQEPTRISQQPANPQEPRCQNCLVARQMCIPSEGG